MALVVDASIALAWGLPDETSAYADAVLAVVEREELSVPGLWPREIANGLSVAYRRPHHVSRRACVSRRFVAPSHRARGNGPGRNRYSRGDGRGDALWPHSL